MLGQDEADRQEYRGVKYQLQFPDLLPPPNNPVNSASALKVGPMDGAALYFILSRHPCDVISTHGNREAKLLSPPAKPT